MPPVGKAEERVHPEGERCQSSLDWQASGGWDLLRWLPSQVTPFFKHGGQVSVLVHASLEAITLVKNLCRRLDLTIVEFFHKIVAVDRFSINPHSLRIKNDTRQ
jgi:hypothetical protein